MLSSYRPIIGTATMNCETTSGGVMMAAMTKISGMAYRRTLRRISGVKMPSLVSTKASIGSSNTTPKVNSMPIIKSR